MQWQHRAVKRPNLYNQCPRPFKFSQVAIFNFYCCFWEGEEAFTQSQRREEGGLAIPSHYTRLILMVRNGRRNWEIGGPFPWISSVPRTIFISVFLFDEVSRLLKVLDSNRGHSSEEQWNLRRRSIIEFCVHTLVTPSITKEAENDEEV